MKIRRGYRPPKKERIDYEQVIKDLLVDVNLIATRGIEYNSFRAQAEAITSKFDDPGIKEYMKKNGLTLCTKEDPYIGTKITVVKNKKG